MARSRIKKGMILCAGLGTRLKPITDRIPKPLVPVLNVENVLHTVRLLERAGISEIIVNLHYLPEHLEAFLSDKAKVKSKIAFSKEEVLLGTGGGVKKAEPFFEGQPFVLANCDFVTNLDVAALIENHFRSNALATMLLFKHPKKEQKYSKVGVDDEGRLCSLPKLQTRMPAETGIFTGIHVIDSTCLKILEEKPSGINEVLYPTLMKDAPDKVRGTFLPGGYWCDTGEVDTFLASTQELLEEYKRDSFLQETIKKLSPESIVQGNTLKSPNANIDKSALIDSYSVVGMGAEVGAGCKLENCVVLPRAKVPANTHASHAIFFESIKVKTP